MLDEYVDGMKRTDGAAVQCKDCHADTDGKGIAKSLDDARDQDKAMSFMSGVMVKYFTGADGVSDALLSCRPLRRRNWKGGRCASRSVRRSRRNR